MSTVQDGLFQYGGMPTGSALGLFTPVGGGQVFFIDPVNGSDGNSGFSLDQSLETIGAAISIASSNSQFLIMPGTCVETVTIPRTLSKLAFIGMGGSGACAIQPSVNHAGAVINHADDVTFMNLDFASEDDTSSVTFSSTGSRLRVIS